MKEIAKSSKVAVVRRTKMAFIGAETAIQRTIEQKVGDYEHTEPRIRCVPDE